MRTIGVATLSRAEYGILRAVLRCIKANTDARLILYVGGTHLSPEFGHTVNEIERDGFDIAERIESLLSADTPQSIGATIGLTVSGFAQAFARNRPDVLLVTGDRYEMAAVALASVPFGIPLAHLDGGAVTLGAFDDRLRHSITKLAHLHLCYTEDNAAIVRAMGEEPSRVIVTGNPALDSITSTKTLDMVELSKHCGIALHGEPLLVVFHSVTTDVEHTNEHVENLLLALERFDNPVVFVLPNADTAGRGIARKMRWWAGQYPGKAQAHANLAPQVYYSIMKHAAAIVGNSSSGIMEAPSFGLPCVNIGTRQAGRTRAANVVDVGYSVGEIMDGIAAALSSKFRAGLRGMANPYGDGQAARRIVNALKTMPIDAGSLVKRIAK